MAIAHGFRYPKGYRHEIHDQCCPQAQGDGHGHLVQHDVDHRLVAEEAVSEVEHGVVLQHLEEAHVHRFVEAEALLELLDELRVQPLGAAVSTGRAIA